MGFALASIGLGLLGSGISAEGASEAGIAGSEAANYQAQIARFNAQAANRNANWTTEAGDVDATTIGLANRAQLGSIKARQAAGGIDVNTGSAADVQAGQKEVGMFDALTARSNAARAAYGYRVTAAADTAQGNLYQFEGEQDKTAGNIAATGSLISGAASAFGKLAQLGDSSGSGSGGPGAGLGDFGWNTSVSFG